MGKDGKSDKKKHTKGHGKDGKVIHKSFSDAIKAKSPNKDGKKDGGKKKSGGGGGKPAYQKSWAKFANKDGKGKDGKAKSSSTTPSSEAVHQETDKRKKKELKVQRASAKPNFELVNNMKGMWNKVRDRTTSDEERNTLVSKMVDHISGNVLQVTLRHDASRMTQCILQYGTDAQRLKILGELLEKAAEIAKTPYGHFTILKAISYCTGAPEQRKICAAIKGHFVALGTNVVGARTCESLLVLYPAKTTRTYAVLLSSLLMSVSRSYPSITVACLHSLTRHDV
jgi:pumilio homology domain family member 6